jgi:hypothetical protein
LVVVLKTCALAVVSSICAGFAWSSKTIGKHAHSHSSTRVLLKRDRYYNNTASCISSSAHRMHTIVGDRTAVYQLQRYIAMVSAYVHILSYLFSGPVVCKAVGTLVDHSIVRTEERHVPGGSPSEKTRTLVRLSRNTSL